MKTFRLWTKEFYEQPYRFFPRDDEVISEVEAPSITELKQLLENQNISPSNFKWEIL